jgi:adenylate cyclase
MKSYHFKTLRGRLTAQLIVPVVLLLLGAGFAGFIYARRSVIEQWNQRVILQLQEGAHEIEMRLSKPMELMTMFSHSGAEGVDAGLLEKIVHRMETLPGVLRVDLNWHAPVENTHRHQMGQPKHRDRFMHFTRGNFAKIAPPQFDASAGEQTVTLSMILLDDDDTAVGNLEIVMKFGFLVADITEDVWWQNAMACIADRETGVIIIASERMQGQSKLGQTGDPLENSVKTKLSQQTAGTVLGAGHPPDRVAGFHGLDMFPWALVVFADGRTVLAPIIHFRNGFFLGGLILIAIIYGIIRLNVDRISGTIRHLSRRAGTVASGDYGEKIELHSEDEIGRLAESFNTMIEGLKERDAIQNTFGLYVNPEFARILLKHPEAGRLGGRRQEVAILMADIRGFTPMTERLSPEGTIEVLNRYFSAIIPLVQKHRGIIVDFVGDGILAFFEPIDESPANAALRGVGCAFDMHAAVDRLNHDSAARDLPELKMGIGVNSGPVVVGNIGSETRKKYGIVGSSVNIVQRIQTQAGAGEVVVSAAVQAMIDAHVTVTRNISTPLKGLESDVKLFAVRPGK